MTESRQKRTAQRMSLTKNQVNFLRHVVMFHAMPWSLWLWYFIQQQQKMFLWQNTGFNFSAFDSSCFHFTLFIQHAQFFIFVDWETAFLLFSLLLNIKIFPLFPWEIRYYKFFERTQCHLHLRCNWLFVLKFFTLHNLRY